MKTDLIKKPTEAPSQLNLPIGVALNDVSLDAPATLDDEQILSLGRTIRRIENASPWWIADYVVFIGEIFKGSKFSPERKRIYDEIQNLWPDYARHTLQNYAAVAKRIPAAVRSPRLSFSHHAHLASLADEPQGRELMDHFIKMAVKTECTAEELRLMLADTKKGIVIEKPKKGRGMKRVGSITVEADDHGDAGQEPGRQDPPEAPPPMRASEPTLIAGSVTQLAGDAQRSLARLREWFNSKARKEKPEHWPQERKDVVIRDLKPVIDEMHGVVEIFHALTGAEQSGDY